MSVLIRLRSLSALALMAALLGNFATTASAATVDNEPVVTDVTDLSLEVNEQATLSYMLVSVAQPDGSRGCNASPTTPVTLSVSPPPSISVFPSLLSYASCDSWQSIVIRGSEPGTSVLTVTASDSGAHVYNTLHATISIFIHVHGDSTAPQFHNPSVVTLEADGPAGAHILLLPDATDADDSVSSINCDPSLRVYPINVTTPGFTHVDCTAVDSHGNVGYGGWDVRVVDTIAPVFTAPSDITLVPLGPAFVNYTTPGATDIVDRTDPVTCSPGSGITYPAGRTMVTCVSIDKHGNAAYGFFNVTIIDTVPPSANGPDTILEATSPLGAPASYPSLSAYDYIDPSPITSCTPAPGAWLSIDQTTSHTTNVYCYVSDHSGNSITAAFRATVQDTTAPTLALPGPLFVQATGPAGAAITYTATASDLVDLTDAVTCSPTSGSVLPMGSSAITCNTVDKHGNAASGAFPVTVYDAIGPAVSVIDQTVEATGPGGATATFSPTALDAVDGALPVSCTPGSGSLFGIDATSSRATMVTCSATDRSGNVGSSSFRVTVRDTTAPALSVPTGISQAVGGPTAITWASSASDLVDGADPIACAPASGSVFPIGTTRVTCSSTDAHGNSASRSFDVVLSIYGPPVLTPPASSTFEATGPGGAPATFAATASDPLDGPLAATCTPASGTMFPFGVTTVTCTAKDSRGLVATGTFTVTVIDTTPPTLALPAPLVLTAGSNGTARATWNATAVDLVDGADAVTCSPGSGAWLPLGNTTVTCTSTDAHGNKATRSFVVSVRSTGPPTITVPGAMSVNATGSTGAKVTFNASGADPIDGALVPTCAPASGSTFPIGVTTVTCKVVDSRGLSASASFTITVKAASTCTGTGSREDDSDGHREDSKWDSDSKKYSTSSKESDDREREHGDGSSGSCTPPPPPPTCSLEDWRPPVDTPGHLKTGVNDFKAGSTVPLKLKLDCDHGEYKGTPKLYIARVLPNGSIGPEISGLSTSGAVNDNSFRSAGIQWLFNWDTKQTSAGQVRVRVDVGDGSQNTLLVTLR